MFGVVIVSQGGVARELLDAGRRITGELADFQAVSLSWEDGVEAAREAILAAVRQVDLGQGVLVLVDMYGSTPCNAALGLLEPGRVEILTGVNLPMVVRLGCFQQGNRSLTEAVEWLQSKVQSSICRPADPERMPRPCRPGEAVGTSAGPVPRGERGE